jgi:hypothetical protein
MQWTMNVRLMAAFSFILCFSDCFQVFWIVVHQIELVTWEPSCTPESILDAYVLCIVSKGQFKHLLTYRHLCISARTQQIVSVVSWAITAE